MTGWVTRFEEGPGWVLQLELEDGEATAASPTPAVGVVEVGPQGPQGQAADEVAAFSFTGGLFVHTGTSQWYFEQAVELRSFRVSLGAPGTAGVTAIDLLAGGVSVLAAPVTLQPGEVTKLAVPDLKQVEPTAALTVDVLSVGTGASDLVGVARARPL